MNQNDFALKVTACRDCENLVITSTSEGNHLCQATEVKSFNYYTGDDLRIMKKCVEINKGNCGDYKYKKNKMKKRSDLF